ncbi:CHAT domain-containing protein [Iningainema tapete]|uniref:CHAT domain-containing protein n=2 Tax=Iningainema TaxID=1932705 RepID=A0A8J7BZ72_9CYAN|nr:CHAT domain-containing protein [Iningainema tapete BLCC-T55]
MVLKRLFLIASGTLLISVSQPFWLNPITYRESTLMAQTASERTAQAYKLFQQGKQLFNNAKFEAAIQSFEQALIIFRENKERYNEGVTLNNLGLGYLNLGKYPMAIKYFQQSLTIDRENNERYDEGVTLNNLGLGYLNLGEFPMAIKYFQQSLVIAREIKDPKSEAKALGNLGLVFIYLGDYAKAIEYLQQQLVIARKIKDSESEGKALGNLGLVYLNRADYAKAIEYSQQWLAIAIEIKDRQGEGLALANIGNAYSYKGDYAGAIKYFQQSLAIVREIRDRQNEAKVLGSLGTAYVYLGNYADGIPLLQQQQEIATEITDRQSIITAWGNFSIALLKMGDYAGAIKFSEQLLALAREIKNPPIEVKALGNLGAAYIHLGKYTKAIEYLEQQLRVARSIKEYQSEGKALGNLGIAYLFLENYPKATEYLKQWLAIARKSEDRHSEAITLNALGITLYKSGNLPAAEKTLIDGIKALESLRRGLDDRNKISVFEQVNLIYSTLQQILIAQNKTDPALEVAERGRARVFVELLASRLSATDISKTSIDSPSIAKIQQIAKAQNATIVQYSITSDLFKIAGKQQRKQSELYIWVIKPTGEVTFRKADLKPLWQKQNTSLLDLVFATRESMGIDDSSVSGRDVSRSLDEYNRSIISQKVFDTDELDQSKNLQQLHQLLIAPIANLLPTDPNQRVIFVPQDELFLVPFPALQDKQGKYLIEKHTILTSPSIQVLELTRQQQSKVKQASTKDAIVVGNPTMPSIPLKTGEKPQQLRDLPGAKQEAEAIATLLNTLALTGKAATKAAVLARLPQAKIIHLATHGLFDDFQGLQSAVALAPSGGDNGLLTADEIFNQKLNADLVVLSACNTGRGRITGDGVIGLSRSLISAGTPSVIVSLWSVPDAPTAELMTEFYTNMLQRRLDKAQALRNAMLKLKDKHPQEPKKWAAFTLIGEAE